MRGNSRLSSKRTFGFCGSAWSPWSPLLSFSIRPIAPSASRFSCLIAIPAAFVGGIMSDCTLPIRRFSVAATVGFVSLGGIAARNGLLLVSTYIDACR